MKACLLIATFMLTFTLGRAQSHGPSQGTSRDTAIRNDAVAVMSRKPFIHGVRDREEQMDLRLTGIYSRGEVLYYRLELVNHSALIYDIDQIRLSIRDKKKLNRHAWQQVFMEPLWIAGYATTLDPGEKRVWVVALRKEVLSTYQYLAVDLLERHGGRNLRLSVGYKKILRTRFVNEL